MTTLAIAFVSGIAGGVLAFALVAIAALAIGGIQVRRGP